MAKQSVKLARGTIFQKGENGNYYFRYQVNGRRKAISLKTKNKRDALAKANDLLPLIIASNAEVVAAHVQHAKGWARERERLELDRIWEIYENHPERARPKSQKIWKTYKSYLYDFISWLKKNYPDIVYMDEIRDVDEYGQKLDRNIVNEYAESLRKCEIAVDTHNKKLARPAHIFRTLSKYLVAESPWENRKLRRSYKEETRVTHQRKPFPPDKESAMFEAVRPESQLQISDKNELEVLFHILKYTGQRQKDCVNLSWNKINMERRRLWVTQEKTGKSVTIPMALELHSMLKKAKEWKINDKVLPNIAAKYAHKSKAGGCTGVDMINERILAVIKYVGLTPSVIVPGRKKKMTIYGAHSFRHGFASHCAETGVPRAVCASILGAEAGIIDTYYVHIGEDAQEKAILALTGKTQKKSYADRVNEAISFIDNLKDKSKEILDVERILWGSSA